MNTRALAVFGSVMLAAGAARAADIAAQAQPPAGVVQRAELLVARQSWEGATAAYREAVAADAKDPVLHNRLGMCLQRTGDAKAAKAEYKRALALRKDYAEAQNNLGTLEHARGKYKQAINAYSRAIQIKPSSAVFHRNLGAAWLSRGDLDKALEAWGEAFRLDPASLDGDAVKVPGSGVTLAQQYYLYAKLLAARGDLERALELLSRAQAAGFREFGRLERDTDFAQVVSDPRYAALK